ncbi:MAG: transglutaminaseTgpA domain-containing protein, partial [Cyanobacteriota bacterium]|nr:transglutaminaseTgpA domain-containing protein [Cyanobacteriota bacterium]
MSNIRLAIYLQSGSLATLWLQLLSMREAQPMVLISLPLLIFLKLWSPPLLQRPGWLPNGLLFGLGMAWLTQISLGAMSGLLISCANLFWLLSGLKLLEALQPAAIRRTGLLLLLAIGMAGVFAQGLGSSLMQGISAFLAVGSLLGLELGAAKGPGLLQTLLLLVSVSLPLMVALFLLAPRIGPLWQLQTGHQTGLS